MCIPVTDALVVALLVIACARRKPPPPLGLYANWSGRTFGSIRNTALPPALMILPPARVSVDIDRALTWVVGSNAHLPFVELGDGQRHIAARASFGVGDNVTEIFPGDKIRRFDSGALAPPAACASAPAASASLSWPNRRNS